MFLSSTNIVLTSPFAHRFYLLLCRYAKRLQRLGKLIALREYDTEHAGLLPGISDGGVADGSLKSAALSLRHCLHDYDGETNTKKLE